MDEGAAKIGEIGRREEENGEIHEDQEEKGETDDMGLQ